jgi:hypothetical protein
MLGSLLIQPQMMARLQGRAPEEEFADEVVSLAQKLLAAPQQLEQLAPVLVQAVQASAERLLQRWQPGQAAVGAAVLSLLEPLTTRLGTLAGGDALSSPAALLRRLADLVDTLDDLPAAFSDEGIRALFQRVGQVLTGPLGLSQTLLHDEARAVLGDIRSGLIARAATLDPATAATAMAIAGLIGRLQNQGLDDLPRLSLGADTLAASLLQSMRASGADALRSRIACWLGKLAALLRAAADLADAVQAAAPAVPSAQPRRQPARSATSRSAAAAPARSPVAAAAHAAARRPLPARLGERPAPTRSVDGTFCWYATWLYRRRRHGLGEGSDAGFGTALLQTLIPGYPEDEVWLSADRKQLILRRANGPDEVLRSSEDTAMDWHESAPFTAPVDGEVFSFGIFPPAFLETWTRISHTAVEGGKGLWHLISMITGGKEHGTNIPLWLWYWGKAVSAGFGVPLESRIARGGEHGMGVKWVFSPLPVWLAVIFGSIEGHQSDTGAGNQFLFWFTLLGGDALNAFQAHASLFALHDLVLSAFTLLNQTTPKPGEPLAANWQLGGPWIGLGSFLALFIMVKAKSADEYSHLFSFGKNPMQALWWLVLAPAVCALGSAIGSMVVWALSRQVQGKLLARELGYGALRGLRDFFLYEYMFKEGSTDGGRYNPKVDPDGNTLSPARVPFDGYPDPADSPYRLPYEKGKLLYAGQAHLGMFSHFRFSNSGQIYALDFSHDKGEEILCIRDGTVVDYFDWFPDDEDLTGKTAEAIAAITEANNSGLMVSGQTYQVSNPANASIGSVWNFVMIRHDTRVDSHDKSQSGRLVTTFAQYGHGKKNGVRDAFALRGIAPQSIIGSVVQQGHVVMLAGDTGVSFHNHLHLQVRGSTPSTPVPATPPPVPYPPIQANQLEGFTLPFVFREVKNILHADGVPWHLSWYASDNEKKP